VKRYPTRSPEDVLIHGVEVPQTSPVVAPPPEPGTWATIGTEMLKFEGYHDGHDMISLDILRLRGWRQRTAALFAQKDAEIARLQAVAALYAWFGYKTRNGESYCLHCGHTRSNEGTIHTDGCPVGRYESQA
jgi:hypothetical protein